ncbi:unnamed protein product [Musa banksii]
MVMEEEVMVNRKVVLKHHLPPDRMPKESDMELVATDTVRLRVPSGSMAVLVKNLYLSCDPYMRSRMTKHDEPSYVPDFVPGTAGITVHGLSGYHDTYRFGSSRFSITGYREWQPTLRWLLSIDRRSSALSVMRRIFDIKLIRIKTSEGQVPTSRKEGSFTSNSTNTLCMPGLTAYAGFYEICSPKKGEHVFISAASGAVGQLVGQFAKLMGCYVVGSAGSDEKVNLLKNKLGFHEAFNYKKEPDLNKALKRCFPEGIDIYFENVGGAMLDAVLANMRLNGRIAVCGMISQYNLGKHDGVHNLLALIAKCIRMQGFLVSNYYKCYREFEEKVVRYMKEGKIVYIEDIAEGLENAPSALTGLFAGRNVGKQLIVVARE